MNILSITNQTYYTAPGPKQTNHSARYQFNAPISDTFEHSCNSPVFLGKKKNSNVSNATTKKIDKKEAKRIEEILKNIDGLHDPYSDIILIPKGKFRYIKGKLEKSHNATNAVNILNKYRHHMFPSDKNMLDILSEHKNDLNKNKHGQTVPADFHSILQDLLPEAKVRLINKQYQIVDDIREISDKKLPKSSQKDVELYLTVIEKDIQYDRFRIKPALKLLRNLYDEVPEKDVVDEIIKKAKELPNTATDTDAFIVKNAGKTHEQIAELLVKPALVSIEHIRPSSLRGESKGANYLAASTRMNNLRSSMPFSEFIEMFPDIPRQTQTYMDDLIMKINRGGLKEVALTVNDVKESLKKESKGLIDVDTSALNPDILKEIDSFKGRMNKLVSHFSGNDE